MESILKIIVLSIIVTLIDGNKSEKSLEKSKSSKNETLIDTNVIKLDNKSTDLVSSDQHFSYSYVKDGDHSYDNNNYENNGKSYLKEVHYFHDKEVGYERKHDWNSDNDEEITSKKTKKDLHNKRNYGKNYDSDDMIEIKKWDDEEPNIYHNNFKTNYKQDNRNNYDNFGDDKNKIRLYSNINLKNSNNNNKKNYKSDGNKDNDNYNNHRKYGTEERVEERGRDYSGYDEDNQKWFTNMEDKDQSGSTDNEVKDEDNYNNFNSPKFIVNFHNFRPWDKIMRNRRHDDNNYNTDKIRENNQDNFEIYSNTQSHSENERDDRFNYQPKLLTNFNIKIRNEKKDNYSNTNKKENYNKNKLNLNDKEIRYKTNFKETTKKLKSKPKSMRYHYEKRVEPQVYATSRPKTDEYGNGYELRPADGDYPSDKNERNRKFIEMPYDMFNTGWSSVQKPMRQRSNRKVVPKVTEYRYGF